MDESIQGQIAEMVELVKRNHLETKDRMLELEQKADKRHAGGLGSENPREAADTIRSSEACAMFQKGATDAFQLVMERKTLLLSPVTPTNDQPLVQAHRTGEIVTAPERAFTIRGLLPVFTTDSNIVEYARELVFTNNAGPQYDASSPDPTREGALKAESGITYELVNAKVITIAHHIPATRQILDDAPQLQQTIQNRLIYGLKLREESEILTGLGTDGGLSGLVANSTAFAGGATNASPLDTIARAASQLRANEYVPSGLVLNPADWTNLFVLSKTTTGEYLLGNPQDMTQPRLFGIPVVLTNAMTRGKFLMADFTRAAAIYDRESVTVRIGLVNDDLTRNIVRILVESRLALAIKQSAAIIYGDLQYAG
jgi:HK97 family phage major capsid protein